MHFDAYAAGKHAGFEGSECYLLGCCGMTGFACMEPISNVSATSFASAIMKILLRNVFCHTAVLDKDEKFIMNLIRAGYKQKDTDTDTVLVDRWFQNICRNIALEVYEQQQADPSNRPHRDSRMVNTKDLGNGKTEVS